MRADLELRSRTLIGLGLGVFAFLLLLGGTYEALGGAEALGRQFGDKTPSMFSAFSGSRGANIFEPQQYLAFGFNHPLFLVLTLTVAIGIGTDAVAGDVENGRAELLYTRPIARTRILDMRIVVWSIAQVLVVGCALAGAALGSRLSSDLRGVDLISIVWVATQYLPLAAFVGGLAFAASALMPTKGRATGLTIALVAGAYLANFVSLLWSPARFVRLLEPFGYYSPLEAVHGPDWGHAAVLLAAAVALMLVARFAVKRRDLV